MQPSLQKKLRTMVSSLQVHSLRTPCHKSLAHRDAGVSASARTGEPRGELAPFATCQIERRGKYGFMVRACNGFFGSAGLKSLRPHHAQFRHTRGPGA